MACCADGLMCRWLVCTCVQMASLTALLNTKLSSLAVKEAASGSISLLQRAVRGSISLPRSRSRRAGRVAGGS
jgi:hypothetical protein